MIKISLVVKDRCSFRLLAMLSKNHIIGKNHLHRRMIMKMLVIVVLLQAVKNLFKTRVKVHLLIKNNQKLFKVNLVVMSLSREIASAVKIVDKSRMLKAQHLIRGSSLVKTFLKRMRITVMSSQMMAKLTHHF